MLRQTLYYFGIKNNPWTSEDALRRLQLGKLKRLVGHAYETTVFYKGLYDESQVAPQSINSLADLTRLPIINKDIVNGAGQDIISDKYSVASLVKDRTSGTSGRPVIIYRSKAATNMTGAAKFRIEAMNGFSPRMKTAHWYLRGIKKRKKFSHFLGLNRQIMISLDIPVKEQVALLQEQRPEAFYCFPSQLVRVARYILENDIQGIRPKLIMIHSEDIQRRELEIIEKCFGVKPVNIYGAREFGTVAWAGGKTNCEGFHVHADLLFVEIIDPATGQRAGEGESGHIVITDFSNLARPLIRYDTLDVAVATYNRCGCGTSFPIIKEFLGRSGESVKLPSGEELTVDFAIGNLVLDIAVVEQYQVIITDQESLLVKLITTGGVRINELELSAKISESCAGIHTEIQYVTSSDEFLTTLSGKCPEVIRESSSSRS